ncbi:MAG: DUF2806 domain-containing protein [Gammaproteobacteria bacterium]|nr:DUF2806 domain-containing protein [Gammaproteobacteria bacterium]
MEVKVTVPGLERLVDVVASGIGSIAGPMLAPWRARRETAAKLIEAEGAAEVLRLQAEAQAEARRVLAVEGDAVTGEIDIGDGIRQRIEFQERKRQANIVAVVSRAALLLADTRAPAVETDHDWTARFFGEVQDVSSDDMQALWGSVLAGEVREPGATSMRTLGILKDLDASTARLFSRLCSAAVYLKASEGEVFDARVPSLGGNAAQNSLESYGLSFDVLNRLNEHALVIPDYNSYNTYVVVEQSTTDVELHHQGIRWDCDILTDGRKKVPVKLHGVALTVAGRELSRFVSSEPMEGYTEALKEFLRRDFRLRMRPI